MVRTHAAFHSALVMCVSRSQNPMQSASDAPPPPGVLGAASLGLAPGDSAMFGCATPPVENCVSSCGESGAMGASSGAGAAISAGGVGAGGDGVGMMPTPKLNSAPTVAADPLLPGDALGVRMGCGLPIVAGEMTVPTSGTRVALFGSN